MLGFEQNPRPFTGRSFGLGDLRGPTDYRNAAWRPYSASAALCIERSRRPKTDDVLPDFRRVANATVVARTVQAAITLSDICSRSACRESCGSDRPVACYRSPAAWRGAFEASANRFSISAFLSCA